MDNNIPGWKIKINEFSPGVFRVTLIDKEGRKVEVIDSVTDTTIDLAKDYAFGIERQLKNRWSKFLYDFCIFNLSAKTPATHGYTESAFGSWIFEFIDKRLLYDGKEFLLIFQTKENGNWTNQTIIDKDEVKYSNFIELIKKLKT